jgi:hypothetical protein
MSASEATRLGPWCLRGEPASFATLRGELERRREQGAKWRERLTLAGDEVFLKASPLAARPALRHALRRVLLRRAEPRLAEFANLSWLRAHGFRAAEPRLAGVFRACGLPRYQFLATRWVEAPRLDAFFAQATLESRAALAAELGRTLARLHALGFVHRDLFARNLLVVAGPAGPEPLFLDAWRGGPGRGLRGPRHDLACLMLDGARLLSPSEQTLFFRSYRDGLPAAPGEAFWRSLPAARARLLPRERRRHPELAPDWNFPGLG